MAVLELHEMTSGGSQKQSYQILRVQTLEQEECLMLFHSIVVLLPTEFVKSLTHPSALLVVKWDASPIVVQATS